MPKKRSILAALTLALSLVVTACGGSGSSSGATATNASASPGATAAASPKKGGVLKVALNAAPPTLDLHTTTAVVTKKIAWHIYETLFTLDKDYKVIPMLAESLPESSADGTQLTIKLRQNVQFHNGQVMKAEDVLASLNRWFQIAPTGKAIAAVTDSFAAKDEYTVVLKLKQPFGTLLEALANPDQSAVIMPASIANAAGKQPVKEYIGTGPYKFVEWKPDQYIRLARFDTYAARTEDATGIGGKKVAYLDQIDFLFVPDETTRTNGIVSGEYGAADIIPADSFDQLKANPDVQLVMEKPYRWVGGVFNVTKPPFSNQKLRQAVLGAVNPAEVMAAAVGPQNFWRLDPGTSFAEMPFHSTAGKDRYNQHNVGKAQQLMKDAGYNGEPVLLLTTKDYPYMYKTAVVTKANLEAAGFKVDLQVYDWATLLSRRADKTKWDMFFTGFTFVAEPTSIPFMTANGTWPGWYSSPAMQQLVRQFQSTTDFAAKKAIADKMDALFYDEVPVIKYGDSFELLALRTNVKGYKHVIDTMLWNVWLDGN